MHGRGVVVCVWCVLQGCVVGLWVWCELLPVLEVPDGSDCPSSCFSPPPGCEHSSYWTVCISLCHPTISAVCGGFQMREATCD